MLYVYISTENPTSYAGVRPILDKWPVVNRGLAPNSQAQPIGVLGGYEAGPKVKTGSTACHSRRRLLGS